MASATARRWRATAPSANGPRPPYEPTTRQILDQWVAKSKAYAAACTHAAGQELFKHVKTTDTVADMESLRIALGQQKINFYGFSYGTYLASVYMTLHPDRVRRFVLDSTVDPRGVWYRANQAQDIAFQKTFKVYMAYLAQYHDFFDVGDTPQEVEDTFLATEAELNANPIDGTFGGDELLDVFTGAGLLRVRLGRHRHGVLGRTCTAAAPSDLSDMYTGANPVHARQRQRLRDVPRHAVHRHAVAAQPAAARTGTTRS